MNEPEERREEEEEARGRGEKTEEEKVEEAAKVAEALNGFTTCAFCGAEFRKDVDGAKITGHIYNCAKHPVGRLSLELASAQGIINDYDKAATEARNALRDAGVPEIEEKGNHRRALTIADRIKILAKRSGSERGVIASYDEDVLKIQNALKAAGVPMFDASGERLLTPVERINILAEWLDAKRPGIPKREGP